MKKFIYILTAILLLFASCSKDIVSEQHFITDQYNTEEAYTELDSAISQIYDDYNINFADDVVRSEQGGIIASPSLTAKMRLLTPAGAGFFLDYRAAYNDNNDRALGNGITRSVYTFLLAMKDNARLTRLRCPDDFSRISYSYRFDGDIANSGEACHWVSCIVLSRAFGYTSLEYMLDNLNYDDADLYKLTVDRGWASLRSNIIVLPDAYHLALQVYNARVIGNLFQRNNTIQAFNSLKAQYPWLATDLSYVEQYYFGLEQVELSRGDVAAYTERYINTIGSSSLNDRSKTSILGAVYIGYNNFFYVR